MVGILLLLIFFLMSTMIIIVISINILLLTIAVSISILLSIPKILIVVIISSSILITSIVMSMMTVLSLGPGFDQLFCFARTFNLQARPCGTVYPNPCFLLYLREPIPRLAASLRSHHPHVPSLRGRMEERVCRAATPLLAELFSTWGAKVLVDG